MPNIPTVDCTIPSSPNPDLPSKRATTTEATNVRPRETPDPAKDQNVPLASLSPISEASILARAGLKTDGQQFSIVLLTDMTGMFS
jgi:hypothetical protein